MNFLQLNSKLTKIAETKDKAVLVFGTSRSGKSTYIGYLCQK
jgi:GTP-binding protein EngB required for normal cell division